MHTKHHKSLQPMHCVSWFLKHTVKDSAPVENKQTNPLWRIDTCKHSLAPELSLKCFCAKCLVHKSELNEIQTTREKLDTFWIDYILTKHLCAGSICERECIKRYKLASFKEWAYGGFFTPFHPLSQACTCL